MGEVGPAAGLGRTQQGEGTYSTYSMTMIWHSTKHTGTLNREGNPNKGEQVGQLNQ